MNEQNVAFEVPNSVEAVGLDTEKDGPGKPLKLYGERQKSFDEQVLASLKENGPINSIRLQRVLPNRTTPTVLRNSLKRLEAEGLIKHSGQKRGMLYEVVADNAN